MLMASDVVLLIDVLGVAWKLKWKKLEKAEKSDGDGDGDSDSERESESNDERCAARLERRCCSIQ